MAAADDRTGVAVPVATIAAGDDPLEAIARLVEEQHADELVVGLPLSLSGALGPQARQFVNLMMAAAS